MGSEMKIKFDDEKHKKARERQRKWLLVHPSVQEENRKSARRSYWGNKEYYDKMNKEWKIANPERVKELGKLLRKRNREIYNSYLVEWSKKNPEKRIESRRRWSKKNPNYFKEYKKRHKIEYMMHNVINRMLRSASTKKI